MERKTIPAFRNIKIHQRAIWPLFILLQLMLIGVAFLGGFFFHQWYEIDHPNEFSLLTHALKVLEDNAYYQLPERKNLEYGMIRGMLQVYNDPFTVFVEPPQHELQTNQLQGKYGGIGVRLEQDADQQWYYLYPIPDSPAQQAGILEGDRLIAIETLQVTSDTPVETIQAEIRGPVDEIVQITIGRAPDFDPVAYDVKRGEVPLPSVTWNLAPEEPRVGVVQINVIADTTPAEVRKAVEDLLQRGARYYVLDVRNNGGGLVEAGVNTARLFLKEGTVIQQQYRGEPVKTYRVDKPGPFVDLPLAVLVNKGTASAAEILTGALQGQKRALVVGGPTYGKDSIQLVFDLDDGSSLHVTAARWWVPGVPTEIKGNGLQPDLVVAEEGEVTPLQTAINAILPR